LVNHKHIRVNGVITNIPSAQLRAGDKIEVREKSKSLEVINKALAQKGKKYPWVEMDEKTLVGTYLNAPEREEIPENINEQLIVELYSK